MYYLCPGHGGGWGYSGHSIEAIRFMADTDLLLGGLSLFGGRGEYFGKIKVNSTHLMVWHNEKVSLSTYSYINKTMKT